ncbi:MAG: LytTR family transcriptional regulator [Clostridia bacterium]|nr:LytTR family transcriptional regulator [Clostridia bacterium]
MKIEFLQDPTRKEPVLAVVAAEESAQVKSLMERLERTYGGVIKCFDGEEIVMLSPEQILRIFAQGHRVLCQTAEGIFFLKERLYEIEAILGEDCFVRISKSELVNKDKILRLDVSLSGTVGVYLEGEIKTYTSRRYVPRIKAVFGLGREAKK